ncbi:MULTISPECIES: hypothetical protein [Listeria]|uniref:hypothetical protein n=1 Tax=Listeria TaxID=1637 RepID=UPI000B597A34|nr:MULTISPECIES: hypothetical protein [Listeria]
MEAKQARKQAEQAYAIYVQEELFPHMDRLLKSIDERIYLRTLDKKFQVNIVIPLKKIYTLSPTKTPYLQVKQEAMAYLFEELEQQGYTVRYRLGSKVCSALLFQYEPKSPYIKIAW